jgi:archaeosine synthase beta-subunit
MEALNSAGEFDPPSLASLERALEYGLVLGTGRVVADLWDIERLIRCPACSRARIARVRTMNATQAIPESIRCKQCAIILGSVGEH